MGLAFQIADDVLDVTATSGRSSARPPAATRALGKSTYPAVLGVDGAIARARELADDACRALETVNLLTPELEHWLDSRYHGAAEPFAPQRLDFRTNSPATHVYPCSARVHR